MGLPVRVKIILSERGCENIILILLREEIRGLF